ncbi:MULTISPECIES: hypothetical protein [Paenibacillus]|nr:MULTISPECIES: hypothetical protein [Paenibacillus]CDN42980.1 hypothetical protein BN871_CH_00070 [Paenibacillus sp. P22]
MRQSVQLDKLGSLSDGMKRLAVSLEETTVRGMAGLERMEDSIRSEYGES